VTEVLRWLAAGERCTRRPSVTNGERDLERRIVESAVRSLLAAGYKVAVFDGEQFALRPTTDETAVMGALFGADEEYLMLTTVRPEADGRAMPAGWVRLVYGNGADVICDYTTNLEAVLTGTNRLAEELP
jgi:hypothetical protein